MIIQCYRLTSFVFVPICVSSSSEILAIVHNTVNDIESLIKIRLKRRSMIVQDR